MGQQGSSTGRTTRRWWRAVGALAFVAPLAVAAGQAPAGAAAVPVRFTVAEIEAAEGSGVARVLVERTDLPVTRLSVSFHTADQTASAFEDYGQTTGTLVFDVGVTSRSFNVVILDDDVVEAVEVVELHLDNGAFATLRIADDDVPVKPAASVAASAAPRAAPVAAAPATVTVTRRTTTRVLSTATPPRRRVSYHQSPVTPFELRPAGPTAATVNPTDVDPVVAFLAAVFLAKVAAEVWFRLRTAAVTEAIGP